MNKSQPLKYSRQESTGKESPELSIQRREEAPKLPFEVIIMAGGKGERLKPLTQDTPKPLLKVGDRPIVEYSLQRLRKAGVTDFTFCVNYLGEKIQNWFGDGTKWKANFSYLFEQKPLGTIGGARLKKKFRFNDLLVINGDLLTTINFERFYLFFIEEEADLAIATIPYRTSLPYGILQLSDSNAVLSVEEKPTYTYHINTGIYFLRRELLSLIPEGKRFDAVDLIQEALKQNLKVASFPLLEYWIDIGQMADYEKAQKDVQFLDL